MTDQARAIDMWAPIVPTPAVMRHVSEHFPLAKAADAIVHLASRKAMGKVVVTMD